MDYPTPPSSPEINVVLCSLDILLKSVYSQLQDNYYDNLDEGHSCPTSRWGVARTSSQEVLHKATVRYMEVGYCCVYCAHLFMNSLGDWQPSLPCLLLCEGRLCSARKLLPEPNVHHKDYKGGGDAYLGSWILQMDIQNQDACSLWNGTVCTLKGKHLQHRPDDGLGIGGNGEFSKDDFIE